MASPRRYLLDPAWLHRELGHNLHRFGPVDCASLRAVARILHAQRAEIVQCRQQAPRSTIDLADLADRPVFVALAVGLEDLYCAVDGEQRRAFEAAVAVLMAHPDSVAHVASAEAG